MAASLAVLLTVTLWVDFVLFKLVQTDRSVVKTMGRKALPVEEDLDRIINVPDSQQVSEPAVSGHDMGVVTGCWGEAGGVVDVALGREIASWAMGREENFKSQD
ncbi:hypothetical protein chiPu_0010350 [Chiloscyllium punctatum]|uniref:Uncharacterized protein n=1 Tax=Chiloscyllium punctatum TaxID=137246 RepID=A0A401SNC5_CHIPU|nr:hypothetical protein [Chiloscyllium punctatum]